MSKPWPSLSLVLASGMVAFAFGLHATTLPAPLLRELLATTLVVCTLTAGAVAWNDARRLRMSPVLVATSLFWIGCSLVLTVGALADLPLPLLNERAGPTVHLGWIYRLVHAVYAAGVTGSLLLRRQSGAAPGLAAVLIFSTLNGSFFQVDDVRASLLLGLTLLVAAIELTPHPHPLPQGERGPEPHPLAPLSATLPGERGPEFPRLLLRRVLGLAAVWMMVATAATWTSIDPLKSFQLWTQMSHWALVMTVLAGWGRRRSRVEGWLALMWALAVVAAISALGATLSLGAQIGWQHAFGLRLKIGFMHSNGSGVFAATFLILGLGLWTVWNRRWQRWALAGGLSLLLLTLTLSYSRSAAFGLICGLAVLALCRGGSNRYAWALALIPLVLIAAATWVRSGAFTLPSRLSLWQVAWNTIWHHPWLGVGPGMPLVTRYSDVLEPEEVPAIRHLVETSTHNLLLEVAQGTGLLGLAAFLGLLAVAGRLALTILRQAEGRRRGVASAVIAATVTLLVPHLLVLSLSMSSLLPVRLWIFFGVLLALARPNRACDRQDSPPKAGLGPWRRPLLTAGICLAAALLVLRPARVEQLRHQARSASDDEAPTVFARWARLEPLDVGPAIRFAQLGGDVDAEVTAYQRAVELRPFQVSHRRRLGWLLWQQGQPESALTMFETAVELDPYALQAPASLGRPQSRPAQVDLGLLYAAFGRLPEAKKAFQQAVRLAPASLAAPDWVAGDDGVALYPAEVDDPGSHRVDEPVFNLRDLSPAPGEPEELSTWEGLAEVALRWGLEDDFESFQAAAERLAEPGSERAADQLARRARREQARDRLPEARTALEAAMAISPRPELHHRLAQIHLGLGDGAANLAALEIMARFWDPSASCGPGCGRYFGDLAVARQAAGQLRPALAARRIQQFLTPLPGRYLKLEIAVAELHRLGGDTVRELEALTAAARGICALEAPEASKTLLHKLAQQTAAAYRRIGIAPEAALREQWRRLDARQVATKLYFDALREALGSGPLGGGQDRVP